MSLNPTPDRDSRSAGVCPRGVTDGGRRREWRRGRGSGKRWETTETLVDVRVSPSHEITPATVSSRTPLVVCTRSPPTRPSRVTRGATQDRDGGHEEQVECRVADGVDVCSVDGLEGGAVTPVTCPVGDRWVGPVLRVRRTLLLRPLVVTGPGRRWCPGGGGRVCAPEVGPPTRGPDGSFT